MRRLLPTMLAALVFAAPVAAHEVWVERDAEGPARIYLGEPGQPVPEEGDPEFHRLKAPRVFLADPAATIATTRQVNHIAAAIEGAGDVRVRDDSVFEPWDAEGAKAGAIFYARAGRSETEARLDLEIVPVSPGADAFTVLFRGRPLAGASVNVISPDRWQKAFTTDASGRLEVPDRGEGRYVLGTAHGEDASTTIAGRPVTKVQHISTLTFMR